MDIYKQGGFWNTVVSANAKNNFFLSNTAASTEENYKTNALISVFVDSVAEHFLQYSFTTSEKWGEVMDTYIKKEINTFLGLSGKATPLAFKTN